MNNQEELNKLVSVHLGKAGDGTVVKPYVTPDEVDPSLLVAVPRVLNRTQYNIDENNLPFAGYDAWNAYEFSTLLKNGFPVSGWVKFSYPSSTPNIVESKSVKLYLNSYNMARIIDSIDDMWLIEEQIERDLSEAVGGSAWVNSVEVNFSFNDVETTRPLVHDYISLEDYCDVEQIAFDHYNESPDILVIEQGKGRKFRWRSHSLRSNCRVTNQPDWGDVYIYIKGNRTVTPESLLQYIVSMRKENHFHEEICECIYKRLYDLLAPEELIVTCLYTRRGGIDINPIRATSDRLIHESANIHCAGLKCNKTTRQ